MEIIQYIAINSSNSKVISIIILISANCFATNVVKQLALIRIDV